MAVGLGVFVARQVPKLSSPRLTTVTADSAPVAKAQQTTRYTLKFVKNPEPVPQFSVQSFSGQTLDPAEWHGKVVILNFWATWCGPCRYEIPELMAMQKRFGSSLQVVGLSVDEAPPAQVKQFAEQMGITYPVAMASEKLQDEFGGILALPTSFIINREGRVVDKHVGLVPRGYYDAEIGYLTGHRVNAKVVKFVDEGQVFPANVKNAKTIPGVDMSMLTPAERKLALKRMNQEHCTCGCGYTIAQCRVLDPSCPVSLKEARAIVAQIAREGLPAKTAMGRPSTHTIAAAGR
jgi:thiol-disulfide isomerase/thioredoxin